MKNIFQMFYNRAIKILIVALFACVIDYLLVSFSHDDSIWIGSSIEVVASIIFGPIVGFFSTLISSVTTDYLIYDSLDYSFVAIFEASSVALIGLIYRSLIKDEDQFGIREIVVFNFVQILVNTAVLYLSTPPAAVLFFGFILEGWAREDFVAELQALRNNTFSSCVSVALIGSVLLAVCVAVRKKYKERGSIFEALHAIFKLNLINKEYRSRAFEYSVGFIFAVALTMVDGVVSSRVLGMDALAATSIVFPLVSFGSFVSMIFTSGCSNLCAIAKGNGEYERSRKLFTLGFMANIFLGILQSVLFYLVEDLYFGYYTTSQSIGILAREYYHIYIFVPPCMTLVTFLDEIVSSDGDDMLSYGGYLSSFGVNVGGSIILSQIMGMGGLALGTLLSYVCYLLIVSIHFLKKSNTYRLRFWFSLRDILRFAKYSLKANISGLCMFVVSAALTKSILLFFGSEYLIANTVLCAMLEIYEMINGPSEAAEYMLATYTGEKNSEGIKTLFKEALNACLLIGMIVALVLLFFPGTVLILYGIEDTPISSELIKSIRYCAIGTIAASIGGFLTDFYGNTGKPLWACIMVIFRTVLFPILFCVTFSLDGGIEGMGIGMLLSQMFAVAIFYGFVLIIKGNDSIPYMLDDPDYEKVRMNSFSFTQEEYNRIIGWIEDHMSSRGVERKEIEEAKAILHSLFMETEEKNRNKKVLGECVLRFIDKPEIIVKDNGELFRPNIEDERYSYNVLLTCNSNTIRI